MMKMSLIKKEPFFVLLSFLMILLLGSCCAESELSLSEIKVCSTAVADLEDNECETSQSSISKSSLFTVSALSYAVESGSELTFKVYQKIDNDWVIQDPLTRTSSLAEFTDECGVRSTQEYKPATEWPEAEVRVDVELNSDPVQLLSRTFRLE